MRMPSEPDKQFLNSPIETEAHFEATIVDGRRMTAAGWRVWLGNQEQICFSEYQRRPSRLVSDFNGERTFWTVERSGSLFQSKNVGVAAAGETDFGGEEFLEGNAFG